MPASLITYFYPLTQSADSSAVFPVSLKDLLRFFLIGITLNLYISLGFPDVSVDKEFAFNVLDAGGISLIPGLGRSPGEGYGYPL